MGGSGRRPTATCSSSGAAPLLVQIFLVYYGLAQFEAVRDSLLWPVLGKAYWCAIIAFSLNTAAYTAEIIRGGMLAVPLGEREAARALGFSRWQEIRLVVLPRALRQALPAYGNEVILLLKGSALASTPSRCSTSPAWRAPSLPAPTWRWSSSLWRA